MGLLVRICLPGLMVSNVEVNSWMEFFRLAVLPNGHHTTSSQFLKEVRQFRIILSSSLIIKVM